MLLIGGNQTVVEDSKRPVLIQSSSDPLQHGPDVRRQGIFTWERKCASLCHSHRLCLSRSLCQGVSFARGQMPSFEEKLVVAIKRKRDAEGLSIRALSAAVGISFSSLARIERGEGLPDNNSKIRLLQWLGADAEDAGLGFDNVAFVHFRAAKNVRSSTVRTLLKAADCLRQTLGIETEWTGQHEMEDSASVVSVSLTKEELEQTAGKFRADLGLSPDEPLDSLKVEVDGVQVIPVGQTNCLDARTVSHLRGNAGSEWSAMTVPLDPNNETWAVLLNDSHRVERQRVTVLEEFWHILLGHRLTKIARVAEAYGRTYDKTEEHDAYYLASATLLPRDAMIDAVSKNHSSDKIAGAFGTSSELVEYRIKRLGLWREHVRKEVRLARGLNPPERSSS
jgi:transcriptional regulator with XRE-family HTH domain